MKAFLNDTKIKTKYVNRVKAHAKADEIIKGTYWKDGKGCAVGCTIEGNEHSKYETELGIPKVIAHLEDKIFEGLPNNEAKEFPLKFLNAITVGADLSMVVPKFFVWLLGDKKDGVIKHAKKDKDCEKAIKQVVKLYKEVIKGKIVSKDKWVKAKTAADAAADAAAAAAYAATAIAHAATAIAHVAYAHADAAAHAAHAAPAIAHAAAAYAHAAAYAATTATTAIAATADAAAYARQEYYSKMANKLLELLAEAK